MSTTAPERFGRYILLRKIASGGMAEIFLAKLIGVEGFEKQVALKKILPQWSADREFISMLIDEAKIAVQLTHPNIIQVYELTRDQNIFSIVMEYVQGVDLRKMMQRAHQQQKKIPIDVVLTMITEVLEGLHYAHTKTDLSGKPLSIVHRDISPQNILLSYEGAVKVTDFGIAKAASQNHETMVGVLKGKFAYMSPEQANQELIDARSDLYATAIVLYEVLTLERLFYRGSDIETLDRVRRGEYRFSEEAREHLPKRLLKILDKALSCEKEKRYTSVLEFREELLEFAQDEKIQLRREKVVQYLKTLFDDDRARDREEETRLMTQATRLLPEILEASQKTDTVRQEEILVRRPMSPSDDDSTRMMAPVEAQILKASQVRKENFFQKSYLVPVLLGVVILGIMGLMGLMIHFSTRSPERVVVLPAASTTPGTTASSNTPQPPEIKPAAVIPASPVEVPVALPSTLPTVQVSPQMAAVSGEEPSSQKASTKESSTKEVSSKDEKKQKENSQNKAGNGFLNVNANPWGYVSVDGIGKRETPVIHMSLKPGQHSVRVSYEPEDKVVQTSVEIVSEKTITCIAHFQGGKGIRCGK